VSSSDRMQQTVWGLLEHVTRIVMSFPICVRLVGLFLSTEVMYMRKTRDRKSKGISGGGAMFWTHSEVLEGE
jgi:hypothetical protein